MIHTIGYRTVNGTACDAGALDVVMTRCRPLSAACPRCDAGAIAS